MKFSIEQSVFSKILQIANRTLPTRPNLPILTSILIEVGEKMVGIQSTNLESAVRINLDCKTQQAGKVAVSGKILSEYISQLPVGELEIERLGEEVAVSSGKYSARFATMPEEDFPAIPKVEAGHELVVDALSFAKSALRVSFSAAQDEGRPILTGVLFELRPGKILLVATDGYRLSYQEIPGIDNTGKTDKAGFQKIIIPAKTLTEVSKIILEEGWSGKLKIKVAQSLNQVSFSAEGILEDKVDLEYTSRLIEGEFPNWQKTIPGEYTTKIKVQKAELLKLVKMASIFAREAGNIIKFKIDAGSSKTKSAGILNVQSQAPQAGSSDLATEVDLSGKGGEIAFNYRYLLEALSAIEEEEVFFEMIESLNPGKLTPTMQKSQKADFFHIIMPVRLQG